MTSACDQLAFRRCALAVSVLYDVDLGPTDYGIVLTGPVAVDVDWEQCADALGDAPPDGELARERLARWLVARRELARRSVAELTAMARPVGMITGSDLHPGAAWVRQPVLGGALDLGLGFAGLDPADPDAVVAPAAAVLAAAGVDGNPLWLLATNYLERMGQLATERWVREPDAALRPMGDCDVVTLLGSRILRSALVGGTGGMRAIAVPMRTRGWLDLSRIDPAFAMAAAAATDPAGRGFDRPLLITADEVALPSEGGRPAEIVLRDPSAQADGLREVLYR